MHPRSLPGQVFLSLSPLIYNQSVPYTLDIQAGLRYIVVGAVIGSIFGIIISGFAVIAFALKTGVQPLVTIQDFWGGMLIGFLISYSGTQVFGNLFSGTATTAATVTPAPTFIPTP